jgi:hypothetical protein
MLAQFVPIWSVYFSFDALLICTDFFSVRESVKKFDKKTIFKWQSASRSSG